MTRWTEFETAKQFIYAYLKENSADPLLFHPKVLIICGSGLGGIAKILRDDTVKIPYEQIPGFKVSTVPGHDGSLLFGRIGENRVPVVCMLGRLHYYEGYDLADVTFPVRVSCTLGVTYMIATNACGGVNESYKSGDLMVISDHINLAGMAGNHPLRGSNIDDMGPRFPAMSDAYDYQLRLKFFNVARQIGMKRSIHEGVYTYSCGPSFETRAECRMIRLLGGDVAGMSTTPEILVARHCGIICFGLSLVTNTIISEPPPSAREACLKGLPVEHAVNQSQGRTSHEEVLREGNEASKDVNVLMEAFVNQL
ncbi:hypothetical protein FOA43_001833 [Brettanomyces nanus]|uniref:Purine nucleoside phosphorylase n=1 Tax=Eeniella nana TaxID=13502 RepID=A0A875S0S0_EENNA|nr:uncharacterized protein FOA43_001833 [Brettanomyces nanus]QPG74503.1 hypothetical protein FOA43_001833 [Brettanomyces nanus]